MKILLITTLYPAYMNQSKIEATYAVHYLAKEWAKKHDVKVIRIWTSYPNIFRRFNKVGKANKYANEESFTLDGVNIVRTPIVKIPKVDYRNRTINKVSKHIISKIEKEGIPDIIICDILNPAIYIGETLASEFGSKLVASLHNSDIFYLSNDINYNKYIKVDSSVDQIIFRSNKIKKNFLELYEGKKDKKNYLTIEFGIDKKDIIDEAKLELKILKSNKIIMVASSLKKIKNIDILIYAFVKIKDKNGYVLKIIGDGPERINLEKLVTKLGCSDYIFFEGEKTRDEVLSYMESSEIFAMVSSPETFGLVYLEAMGKGCITIGSKDEGIDGVIVNNNNGYLCAPNNIDELKTILEEVINLNIDEKSRIINNAISTAMHLNNEELANRYLEWVMNK